MKNQYWLACGLASALAVSAFGCDSAAASADGGAGGGTGTGGGRATGGGTGTGGGSSAGGGTGTGGGSAAGGGTGTGGGSAATVVPATDVLSGSGRLTGGNLVLDAQLGQGIGQQPVSNGTLTLQGSAANKP